MYLAITVESVFPLQLKNGKKCQFFAYEQLAVPENLIIFGYFWIVSILWVLQPQYNSIGQATSKTWYPGISLSHLKWDIAPENEQNSEGSKN